MTKQQQDEFFKMGVPDFPLESYDTEHDGLATDPYSTVEGPCEICGQIAGSNEALLADLCKEQDRSIGLTAELLGLSERHQALEDRYDLVREYCAAQIKLRRKAQSDVRLAWLYFAALLLVLILVLVPK